MENTRIILFALWMISCTGSDPLSNKGSASKSGVEPMTAENGVNNDDAPPIAKMVITNTKVSGGRESLYDIGILRRAGSDTAGTANIPAPTTITTSNQSAGGSAENRSRPLFPTYWPLLETASESRLGTDSRFSDLVECWFNSSAEWMFGEGRDVDGPIEIRGQEYLTFNRGIGPIIYGGGLNRCFADIAGLSWEEDGERDYDGGDNVFAHLTNGIGLYGMRMDGQRRFGYYNPQLISWGIQNLMPEKDAIVAGVPFQLIYDVVLSGFARRMADVYLNLVGTGDIESEAAAYIRQAESGRYDDRRFYGPGYLYDTWHDRNDTAGFFHIPRSKYLIRGATWKEPEAFGFWLRRYIDGTQDELWSGLEMFLTRFDPDFLSEISEFAAAHDAGSRSNELNFPSLSTVTESEIKQESRFTELASCWFSGAPMWAFGQYGDSETTVSVDGEEYQTFDQGILTLFYRGGLSGCIADVVDRDWKKDRSRPHHYGQGVISVVSDGIPLYGLEMHDNQPFGYYNPDIISWGVQTMLPNKDDSVGGAPIQLVYHIVFARFVRMMAETYLDLQAAGDLAYEADRYKELAQAGWGSSYGDENNFYGPNYLLDRFGQRHTIPPDKYRLRFAGWTLSTSYGFWLRRYLDGTHDELWRGFEIILQRFDPDFLREITVEYL